MLSRWRPVVAGHWWTVAPELWSRLRPVSAPDGRPWHTLVDDHRMGPVRLTGVLGEQPESSTLLMVVHGLGGRPDSTYCARVAGMAALRGWSTLRLGMRGSPSDGEDIYHAGLHCDLAHALEHPALRRYDRILVLGYSLGGHLALGHALQPTPRVAAVAAVSAPLDLARSCQAIDRRRSFFYRHHVLGGLKEDYARVAARRPMPTPTEDVRRVRTLREWDRLTVVPRFGFEDVDDYYRRASVGPRLGELVVPSLYLGMRHDPMVPAWAVEPSLLAAPDGGPLEVRWLDDGGHIRAPGDWESGVLDWLDRHAAR